ncbi:hypothetical protein N657DRAFT_637594 [Parathielavia appendiculata]|uniref:Uncharacterized protein n=1 Tax=Parathielavia appendiculata TaxID=2587402 RepID=A0AAN6TQZ4_9PEZI|nr:hypothetical protein N657DRAFT_637594 [Parathielavia appendiculata]
MVAPLRASEKASVPGVPREIRLRIYSLLLKADTLIDTFLVRANEATIAEVRWASGGSTFYYNHNLFDCHSSKQCLSWLNTLTPRTRRLDRHIALMRILPELTANLRTVYLPSTIVTSELSYWHRWFARRGEPQYYMVQW